MVNKPKLTIITICFNASSLEATCNSIINQTYQDFEWIVVDGGSNKKTQKIFNKYKYRIDTFISEKDNGRYDAMNKGIKIAHGEYINFLNAGDFYDNDTVLAHMIPRLKADVVYGNLKVKQDDVCNIIKYPNKVTKKLLTNWTIPHPASFIKKSLFDKYGAYSLQFTIVSDWEKWINFFVNGASFKHINHIVSVFDTSGISSTNNELNNRERYIVLNRYFSTNRKVNKFSLFCKWCCSIDNDRATKYKVLRLFGIKIMNLCKKYEK